MNLLSNRGTAPQVLGVSVDSQFSHLAWIQTGGCALWLHRAAPATYCAHPTADAALPNVLHDPIIGKAAALPRRAQGGWRWRPELPAGASHL